MLSPPVARYVSCYFPVPMQGGGNTATAAPAQGGDILFACSHCGSSFVVDAAAAGVTLRCQSCGEQTTVPQRPPEAAAENSARLGDLQHQLKENESQRTEITGYINQLGIQLHRWQLRLQTLNDRQKKLQTELGQLSGPTAK